MERHVGGGGFGVDGLDVAVHLLGLCHIARSGTVSFQIFRIRIDTVPVRIFPGAGLTGLGIGDDGSNASVGIGRALRSLARVQGGGAHGILGRGDQNPILAVLEGSKLHGVVLVVVPHGLLLGLHGLIRLVQVGEVISAQGLGVIILIIQSGMLHHQLTGVGAVHQNGLVGLLGGVGVGVAQLDVQLFDLNAADVLLGVGHIDLHVGGELIDEQVTLVPQLQGVVAVDVGLPDGGVQVADAGEDIVDHIHILTEGDLGVFLDLLELGGVGIELLDQGLGRGADLNVVLRKTGLVAELLQLVKEVAELCAQDAEGIIAVAHLVQHTLNIFQTGQLCVHSAHAGHFAAVADVQIGVTELGDARTQNAVADPHIVGRVITVTAAGVEAGLIQLLAGVAGGVDVCNIVARHAQTVLGGVDAQTSLGEGTKGTNAHSVNSLYLESCRSWLRRGNPSAFWAGSRADRSGSRGRRGGRWRH